MSERNHGPDWDLIKAKMDNVRIRVGFALDRAAHEVKYRAVVPNAEHKQAAKLAEAFVGEALTFLKDDLTAKLQPLHPTKEQVRIFQYLMESTDDGSLILKSTEGRLSSDNRPFVVKHYEAGNRFESTGDLADKLTEIYRGQDVRLIVRRGVHEPFPHGFAVFGSIGMTMPGNIDFIAFPDKPQSTEDVQKVMMIPEQQDGFTQRVGVYNKGERIIINREGVYQGEDVAMTDQYHLVGAFDGLDTGKTYWLYGSNSEIHDKMSVSKRVGVKNLAEQRVNK